MQSETGLNNGIKTKVLDRLILIRLSQINEYGFFAVTKQKCQHAFPTGAVQTLD
jgi:hypothetical protein